MADQDEAIEEIDKKDYTLLSESEENIRKIDFDTIIFRQLDRISRSGTEGNLGSFGNGISIQDALLEALKDKQFFESEKNIVDKYEKIFEEIGQKKQQENIDIQPILAHYQSELNLEKLKNMIRLLGKNKKI